MPIPFVTFKPAEYHRGKNSYIFFYAMDPVSKKLKRKIVKMNHIHKKTERDRYAKVLLHTINEKLYSGWNPFLEQMSAKAINISDAIARFMKDKEKCTRKDTMRSYRSYSNLFLKWLTESKMDKSYCVSIDRDVIISYLDYIDETKNLSSRTLNNYSDFIFTLFDFFVEKGYIKDNPAANLKKRKVDQKTRVIIPKETRARIKQYFMQHCQNYYYVMQFCYRLFVRPKEISMLKVGDIDFVNRIVRIPASVAKNHKERELALPDELFNFLSQYAEKPKDWYLFANRNNYGPGARKKPLPSTRIAETWSKMRTDLNLPSEYQFYSLKDTGITEMLEAGVPAKFVKELADHHSLEMTERYTHRSNAKKILEYNNLDF